MMTNTCLVAVDVVQGVVAHALERAGLTAEDAAIVRDALLDAELTGRTGHGLIRVPPLCAHAAGCGSDKIRVTRDSGTVIALDAGGALGYLAAHQAARWVADRLDVAPLVAVGCRGTSHAGAIGYYARYVAEHGHAALAMADCCPMIAPHEARRPVFGTNPLAFACPGPAHPYVADFSPGKTTFGAIKTAQHAGRPLPDGVAMDADGAITTDPGHALDGGILPIGGPKGSALAFLIQAVSGALCGAAGVPRPGMDYGFFLLGIRLDAFVARDAVMGELSALAEAVHAAGASCPGDRSAARRASGLMQGLNVDEMLWAQITALASPDAATRARK